MKTEILHELFDHFCTSLIIFVFVAVMFLGIDKHQQTSRYSGMVSITDYHSYAATIERSRKTAYDATVKPWTQGVRR